MLRYRLYSVLFSIAWLCAGMAAAQPEGSTQAAAPRPRIGLVLSGGGARGLAHVGVLKVLERERVPIDLIAGTSMGAIVGGLYASGMSAAQIEAELGRVRWADVFATRVDRQLLSQRRKEEDYDIASVLELGVRNGELRTPQAAVSSRELETMLRRFTLPARQVTQFDKLPIPFRALATDMESGDAVVLSEGDLALALRSSMSVPGLFAPTEWQGRLLGDGGLVNNVPVDVARAMGADVLIVVNVGTPLAGRDTLGSVIGLTAQMVNILTEQNVRRSLASLRGSDLLIQPQLGTLAASDFEQAGRLIGLGEEAAASMHQALQALALTPAAYAAEQQVRRSWQGPQPALAFVDFTGSTVTNPKRFAAQLETQPAQPFDVQRAERDTRHLAASGDYSRTNYSLQRREQGEGLVFELEDKPWGPNYLRVGLDLSTDFAGRSAFNLKLSHNRHWLTANGTEWRNRLQLGEVPALSTELYHPLNWTLGLANDWFAAAWANLEQRRVALFSPLDGTEQAQFNRTLSRVGLDIGQPWAALGELRLGVAQTILRTSPHLLGADYTGARVVELNYETGLRARVVIDQLDFASFPQAGYRAEAEAHGGRRSGTLEESFFRLEAQGSYVHSIAADTFAVHAALQLSQQQGSALLGRYPLGGFHNLSGYQSGQLYGNQLLFTRLTWYRRLPTAPVLTRGFFIGATLEAGNVWEQRSQIRLSDLRKGASLFLGADTGIGPLYLGLTYAPSGSAGVVLFIGRP